MADTIMSVIGIRAMRPAEEDSLSILLSRSWLRVGGTFDFKAVWFLSSVFCKKLRGICEVPGSSGCVTEVSESVGVVSGSLGETLETVF